MARTRTQVVRAVLVLVVAGFIVLSVSSIALGATGTIIAWQPSHQNDTGSNGWHEYQVCGDITQRTMALLPTFTNVLCWETGMGLQSINYMALLSEINQENAAHAQVTIAVHVDGGRSSGVLGCYYAGDTASSSYAQALLKSVAAATGLPYLGVSARTDLLSVDPALNQAPIRVVLELGDNAADRVLLDSADGRQELAVALAAAVNANTPPPPSPPMTRNPTRYEQTDSRLVYSGTWTASPTSSASGGSFSYAKASGGSVIVSFIGTRLAWIAKRSPSYGKAKVTLDGGAAQLVDLYSATTLYAQKVWETPDLSMGVHTLRIDWTGTKSVSTGGPDINVDAFDVMGQLVGPLRYQQTDSHLVYAGTWYTFSAGGASGGSYARANTKGASVTVTFTGTYLAWIATAGTTLSKAYVSLDGGTAQSINLARSAVAYQQKVWNTGPLTSGKHIVKIWWNPANAAGKYISVDAFDVVGLLN